MRNRSYNHHLHHKNIYHRNGNPTTTNTTNSNTTTFFPMLCRLSSIKDSVYHPRSSICPQKDDPSSPRVSCMGQVKRHQDNKLMIPFPTPSASVTSTKTAAAAVNYNKLKKIFSGKNLTTTTSNSCRISSSKEMIDRRRPKFTSDDSNDNCAAATAVANVVSVNLAELDPPLPVVKRVKQPCCDGGGGQEGLSLWKRRSGGDGLKGLQIQPFQLPNNWQLLPPTTVG